jgi:2-amino-4-hydroxy-6-hydroxymethyldihydropteridine diphosphokinase
VALGSNLAGEHASSEALLDAALAALGRVGMTVVSASEAWRSAAWPDPGAPEFRNRVAVVETRLSPSEAMRGLLGLEQSFGRVRGGLNAARTLDLDLIDHGGWAGEAPGLTLPHPRAHERLFVMGPLAEIAPEWVHPVLGLTAVELASSASVGVDAGPVLPRCNMER